MIFQAVRNDFIHFNKIILAITIVETKKTDLQGHLAYYAYIYLQAKQNDQIKYIGCIGHLFHLNYSLKFSLKQVFFVFLFQAEPVYFE